MGPAIAILIYCLTLIGIVVPHVKDPVLKIGVVVYAGIIGSMIVAALTLSLQETALKERIRTTVLPAFKNSPLEKFFAKLCAILKGGKNSMSFQYYIIGALLFLVSDSTLGYSKFVEQSYRQNIVLGTYYSSLLFFTWSTFEIVPCAPCLKKSTNLSPKKKSS